MNRIEKLLTIILIMGLVAIFAVGIQKVYVQKNNNRNIQVAVKINSQTVKQEKPELQENNAISLEDTVQIVEQPEKEIDDNGIVISSEIQECIKKIDNKNFKKNVQNYKQLLIDLEVPDNYKSEIENMMKKGYIISDILTAYEFLYESYGLIDELEGLLEKKKAGKTWAEVFKGYNKTYKDYVPSNFKSGYLEELLKDPNITVDDVMNADRISQKGIKKFDQLMKLEKDGYTREEINGKIGIVNTAEEFPRVELTHIEVMDYEESIGLSEEQVVDALVMAKKMDEDEKKILKMVKKGSKKEDILAQHYSEKYK